MTTICCQCQRTKEGNNWKRKFVRGEQRISHGYCPKCYRKVIEKISSHLPSDAIAAPLS